MKMDETNGFVPFQSENMQIKDRRRFLKKLAIGAVAVPIIIVLPPNKVALSSGGNIPQNDFMHKSLDLDIYKGR